jgi:hypothetical protein
VFVEFDDPTDRRRRFRCDLTWLMSSWLCIYAQGCKSMFAAVPEGGCCVIVAHFANDADRDRVAAVVSLLGESTWQHHPGSTAVDAWSESLTEGEVSVTKTRVVDGACIFLHRTGFGTGAGCAMHWLGARRPRAGLPQQPGRARRAHGRGVVCRDGRPRHPRLLPARPSVAADP